MTLIHQVRLPDRFSRRWLIPVVIILVAMLLRGGYLLRAPRGAQFGHVDAQGYHRLAVNLLERGVFSMQTDPPFRPDNVRAPLYPLFVAFWYGLGGPNPDVLAYVHMLLDVLTVVLLYRLGMAVGGRWIGRGAALLYALNPSSWRFCNELLTEIPFGLLLTAAVWMLARFILHGRIRDAWRCGGLFGLAILCKPNVQFLPLVLLVILAQKLYEGRRRWWQSAAVVLGVISVMLLPWVVRNRVVFGAWFYTRTFEDNLAHVSAVSTLAEVRGEPVAPWSPAWEALYDEIIVRTALRHGWQEVEDAQISAPERDTRLLQTEAVAREIVMAHPVSFLTAHARAWFWSFVPQEHKFWYTQLTGTPWSSLPVEGDAFRRALQLAGQGAVRAGIGTLYAERIQGLPPLALLLWLGWGAAYAVAAILVVAGALRLRPRILALFIVATVFYVTFVPGPIAQIRFRLPVTPLILLLVAVGVLGGRGTATAAMSVAEPVRS